ncbi:MAG: hypothetical protein E4H46_01325 [Desulfobacterales bacterium]|nr:MAG: hypothetical protein E4H46_01325 [Desulfobacterales bacterium]
MTATLNSYTLKDKYFDNEIVIGKAEIDNGAQAIANGKLHAKIVKISRGGLNVFETDEYTDYWQAGVSRGRSFLNKTYLVTKFGLIEYDRSTGKYVEVLDRKDLGYIYITPDGELWLSTHSRGVLRRDVSGIWTTYTTADGLLNNQVLGFVEMDENGQKATWMNTSSGISVLSNNSWRSYTYANGSLPAGVNGIAKGSDNSIYILAFSYSITVSLYRFNGSKFEIVATPSEIDWQTGMH